MSIQKILAVIMGKLSGVGKWQRDFILETFLALFSRQGRATFENLARYSRYNELTFRRGFSKFFDWLGFNLQFVDPSKGNYIGVLDCSFVEKSGRKTYGLDKFWSGCVGTALQGLEVSVLACINVSLKQSWVLDASQTPAGLAKEDEAGYSRIDFYLEQLLDCLPLLGFIRHFVADGYYAKEKVFRVFAQAGKHLITKLRSDADLYFLWQGGRKPGQLGANRKYDGKVDFKDLSRWQEAKTQEENIQLYGQRLYSKRFKRTLLVVLILNIKTNKYVLLASTDLEQDVAQVLEYYQLRFQIEFIFRDAKQFMGLAQCQARDQDKLDFHLNLCLSAVNVARTTIQQDASYANSMNAFIRRQTNHRIAQLIYDQLRQQPSLDEFDLNTFNLQHWPNKAA